MKMNLERLQSHLIYSLDDNGDWEYTREGIGVLNGHVFLVDLDDSGEEERELHFVKEGLQVHQVLAIGKKHGRYEQFPSGEFRYNIENENVGSIKLFCEEVGVAVPDWIL